MRKASRTLTLSAEEVKKYAEITGDYNPLHFDEKFAANTPFKNLVVQGGLTTGLLHGGSLKGSRDQASDHPQNPGDPADRRDRSGGRSRLLHILTGLRDLTPDGSHR